MSTLLRVDASIRLEGSVSRALADSAEAAWKAEHPDGVVVRRDLGQHPLPSTVWPTLARAQVLGQEAVTGDDRAALAEAQALAAELVAEIREADAVLLAVPLYNYGIAQNVKTWIDVLLIDRELSGSGQLKGRPAIFALARGGGYGPGTPKDGWDHATPYLERIFGDVYGMNIRTAAAELTLAPVTPGMEGLIDASKVSESEAHVEADKHGTTVARELIGKAA
ncbi:MULTISPECIES: FMN-dependent NADH-azoreductase [Kribbella]|uniref:FMN dependent NADH:quinone oxidoreductase n=1 Tax=Kribbella karoonensis TaxID=324851 RepID=A0ABN2EC52_9ACTN